MVAMAGKGLVGVDIGHYNTKVVHFENKKGIVTLKNIFKERTPEGIIGPDGCDEIILGEFLKSIFSEHKVKSKNVAFGLNSSYVISKTLKMPLVVDEEIEQAIMWEAEQYAPVGMDKVNVSYQVFEKDKEKNEMTVLIAITKKNIVESYRSAFKRAKLKLEVVDVDLFAAANIFMFSNSDKADKHVLIADLGYSSAKLVFIKNKRPMFTRYMDFSFSGILRGVIDTFSVGEDEVEYLLESKEESEKKTSIINYINEKIRDLYIQIQNSITFYYSNILDIQQPLDYIVFTGVLGLLYDYVDIEYLRNMIKSDIVQFNPFDFVSKEEAKDLEEITNGKSALYTIASGLSLRGIKE